MLTPDRVADMPPRAAYMKQKKIARSYVMLQEPLLVGRGWGVGATRASEVASNAWPASFWPGRWGMF